MKGKPMKTPREKQFERLFFIEYLAIFVGRVSRKDLVARFGISEPAATKDFALYTAMAPDVLRYDLRQKCYVLCKTEPYFTHHVEQSLYSLAGERAIGVEGGKTARLASWIATSIRRELSLDLASAITRGIHLGLCVEAEYLSLTKGVSTRKLSPMALVNDGLRWHARCYDHAHEQFRDFSLTRFSKVQPLQPSSVSIDLDADWRDDIVLELVAHPKAAHPESIHIDFDMVGGVKHVCLKRCLVAYFLKHWNIDTSADASGDPNAKQLYLNNRTQLIAQGVSRWAFS
jgi:predicted DNA-binding transcriptional regulator YafY